MKLLLGLTGCLLLLAPLFVSAQVPTAADSAAKLRIDSLAKTDSLKSSVQKDTVVIRDTVQPVAKSCYAEWQDAFRTRGAKKVTDGMQQVVIAIKDAESSRCFMGQIEVAGGKIKPPLYFQQENGEYRPVSVVGKKIEPAFGGSMTPDELYAIKDGMSIVFRTTDQEYGRLYFFKFVNKSSQSNKEAASPSELLKD